MSKLFNELKNNFEGEIFDSLVYRSIYATDASVYREMPLAVTYPKSTNDIKTLIQFAQTHKIPLIPRGAGTSLAGQVVGKGIIVDVSKYLNKILEININEKTVTVEPGVILDELNFSLSKYKLFFAPETSTSNRCTIGGMIGNNSCGARSLIYGSTRDHLLEVSGFLSDGSYVTFKPLTKEEFFQKCELNSLEGNIYRQIKTLLNNPDHLNTINEAYPDPRIRRRNMGYAIDLLAKSEIFDNTSHQKFNFCKLIAGSEGTLFIITEAKLNLVDAPPTCVALLCVHTSTLNEAFKANLIALNHFPNSVELMDNTILNLALQNIEQQKNSFFVNGNPAAILIIELVDNNYENIRTKANKLIEDLKKHQLGYAFPLIEGQDTKKVWNLRKAGLGVLSNMKGSAKPVAVIEDTAVHPEFLEAYIHEIEQMLKKYGLSCVYYAHIGTGEIHLRPVLNLKSKNDKIIFRKIAEETAEIVKKYRGSLSGEHGDGRLRSEFIPFMFGEEVYQWLKKIKYTWDPYNIFNPGKIIDAPPMDSCLRFHDGYTHSNNFKTYFDFTSDDGLLSSIEKCNGSADCRKSKLIGGTMCPSYMATRDEKNTTRARANLLREIISTQKKPFNNKELYNILDLCLSCKGCKSECPSNIDMAKFKAEFLQHYYETHRIPLRTFFIANITFIYQFGALIKPITNFVLKNYFTSTIIKRILKIAPQRNFPVLSRKTFWKWAKKHKTPDNQKQIYVFNDEFTNYIDSEIGIYTVLFLEKLGYSIKILPPMKSGRTYISKGLVKRAQKIAQKNIRYLSFVVPPDAIIVGIEPSTILTFRDEYLDFNFDSTTRILAKSIVKQVYTIEEFIYSEFKKGNITREHFTNERKDILVHIHCQFKAIADKSVVLNILQIPANYKVTEISSGCCGMAGSFGFEKEHYDLSMKIGELKLFPTIRNAKNDTIIVANGTSCRQQILEGTQVKALHPIEVLYKALI